MVVFHSYVSLPEGNIGRHLLKGGLGGRQHPADLLREAIAREVRQQHRGRHGPTDLRPGPRRQNGKGQKNLENGGFHSDFSGKMWILTVKKYEKMVKVDMNHAK